MKLGKQSQKGYIFTPFLILFVFIGLLFVYISFIFPSLQIPSTGSGVTSKPQVTDEKISQLTLNCSVLGLQDGWCQATKLVTEDASHSFTFLYPQTYSVENPNSANGDVEVSDASGKLQYSVKIKSLDPVQQENPDVSEYITYISPSEKVQSTKDTTVGKEGYKALEVSTASGGASGKYYIFKVATETGSYLYLLKFSSTVDPKLLSEIVSTFSVAVL